MIHVINVCGFALITYLFPALLASQIPISFMSAVHVSPILSPLHLRCVGSFEQVTVPVLLYLVLFVN